MTVLRRYYEEGSAYFITTVKEKRRVIFNDPWACDLFISVLTYNKFVCGYEVYGFVLMPDHVHVVLRPRGEMNISEIMKRVKGNFSRFYNQVTGLSQRVWESGFYDEGIRDQKQLMGTLEYMHNNPLRKGLVMNVGKYRYSSYRFYAMDGKEFGVLVDRWD